MERKSLSALMRSLPAPFAGAGALLAEQLAQQTSKIVVLDDDPTGVQTVHDVPVYTGWSAESLYSGFCESGRVFYILTNSRSFSAARTREAHMQLAQGIAAAARKSGRDFLLVSRGDSTLRGHYPLETEVLRQGLEDEGYGSLDGEILCPFFPEGGRYTADDVHYVLYGDELVPCGETEFAADRTFGYHSSNLRDWIQEKTGGATAAGEIYSVSLAELRAGDVESIRRTLRSVTKFGKVLVNALCYEDLQVFCAALYGVLDEKRFLMRTAAPFVTVLGGISPRGLLRGEELLRDGGGKGGLILAGSHTKKTTEQLRRARSCPGVTAVEIDQHLAAQAGDAFEREIVRVSALVSALLEEGRVACVSTRRERLDLDSADPEEELALAVRIAQGVTQVVRSLTTAPAFLIAKGGITSSDIGVKGLNVRRAVVAGQILPGVPVWICGAESRFPGMPYVIFPGNVGGPDSLREAIELFGMGEGTL